MINTKKLSLAFVISLFLLASVFTLLEGVRRVSYTMVILGASLLGASLTALSILASTDAN